ncbi:pyridoxal-phosphate dependent enzyme [Frankia sp. Cas3]|uniref:pyridoxal-phosphate dependent enzyme n=1 Tax=Frankia sp. Cas3 TaxID=3073926 RepID=UPI002AD220EF|nr:pyridoxal-phosphate dependent enzyme [Frankia sp. Cas3]
MTVVCPGCGNRDELNPVRWRCSCGGLFDLEDHDAGLTLASNDRHGMWRYAGMLHPATHDLDWQALTLGEGMTPLVSLETHPTGARVLGKLEYVMPTLSFKDRGAVMLVAAARRLGVRRMVADSSGNAGTAIAAYAARAGIPLEVYVPTATSAKKTVQMRVHGAVVHWVDGNRAAAADAAIGAVERSGAFYASHVYNPLFVEGVKTFAFELVEQLHGKAPDLLVLPVGNGTLVLGTYRGFRQLQRSGLVDDIPPILAVQARRCAPIAAAFAADAAHVAAVAPETTMAEGIAIAAPPRGAEILAVVRASNGRVVTAPEEAILPAQARLAARGLFVEPTAAATYAGLSDWLNGPGATWITAHSHRTGRPPLIVLPLCGAGLKAT